MAKPASTSARSRLQMHVRLGNDYYMRHNIPEWMFDTASFPHLEIAKDIDRHAYRSTNSIEEDQMAQGSERK